MFSLPDSRFMIHESIYTTDDAACTATWAPPEAWTLSEEQIRIMAGPFAEAGGDRADLAMGVLTEMAEVHPSEPHWYLEGLGTHTDWQRRGLASQFWPRFCATATPMVFPPTLRRTVRATFRSTAGMGSRSSTRSSFRMARRNVADVARVQVSRAPYRQRMTKDEAAQ